MIKAKLLWTQTCVWLGNIFWISEIKYELCCDHLTINLSTSTVNFQTFPTIYSSCEKKYVCHHHKCELELLKNLDVFHVCEIRGRVRPEWSEGVEGWQDHLWAVGEDPTKICRVVKEHKVKSKVKCGHIMRATLKSPESISHSPITYFDVYLRDSPWKPITHCSA